MLNKVELIGHIGRIEQKEKCLTATVATTKSYQKDGEWIENTTWHNLVMFRKNAEIFIKRNIAVGDLVRIEGELSHTKKNDGSWFTNVIVYHTMKLKSNRQKTESEPPLDYDSKDMPEKPAVSEDMPEKPVLSEDTVDVLQEELPF